MPHFARVTRKTAVNFDLVSVIDFNEKGVIVDEENEVYMPTARLLIPDEGNQLLVTGQDAVYLWENCLVRPDGFAKVEKKIRRLLDIVRKLQLRADRVFSKMEPLDPWPDAEQGKHGFCNHEMAKMLTPEGLAELRATAAATGDYPIFNPGPLASDH